MSTKAKKKTLETSSKEYLENWKNPMKRPFLEKIVLNIGVGQGGDELAKAVNVLETITNKKALQTLSKVNVKEFNLRIGRPIGAKVTVRGQEAITLLKRIIIVNNNKILRKSFDDFGNFGFGVKEHIQIPNIEYDNEIGIWGLDCVGRVVRPGMRVKNRKKARAKISKHHYLSRQETQFFLKNKFGIEIVKKLELDYI